MAAVCFERESFQQADKSWTPFHTCYKILIPVSTLVVWNERRNALTQFAWCEKKNKRRSLNTLNLFCYYGKRRNVPDFSALHDLFMKNFPTPGRSRVRLLKIASPKWLPKLSSEIIVSSPLALILALRYEVCESAGRFIGGRAIILRPLCPSLSFGFGRLVLRLLSRKKNTFDWRRVLRVYLWRCFRIFFVINNAMSLLHTCRRCPWRRSWTTRVIWQTPYLCTKSPLVQAAEINDLSSATAERALKFDFWADLFVKGPLPLR